MNGSCSEHCLPVQAHTLTEPVGLKYSCQEAARQLTGAVEPAMSNLLYAE